MQRVSMQLVRELKRKKDVEVRTELMESSWQSIGLKTTGFLLKQIWQLPRIAREFNADVILFSSMVTASLAVFIHKRVQIPMVTINHGQDVTLPSNLYQWFVPKVFKRLDGVISVSRATRQACIERGMSAEKGIALPNGFDLENMDRIPPPQIAKKDLQQLFDIPLDNHRMILSVGRQVKRKGQEWFIRYVFPKVNSETVFVIVGDGPEFENIQQALEEVEERKRVYLLGRQPDEILQKCYAAADIFVMPNIPVEGDMEGFGIVMLEANMGGTPVIASKLEGIKDVIADGENGHLIPVGEEQLFAAKIDEVLKADPTVFQKKTRSYIQNNFAWNHVVTEYIEYLKRCIHQYGSERRD